MIFLLQHTKERYNEIYINIKKKLKNFLSCSKNSTIDDSSTLSTTNDSNSSTDKSECHCFCEKILSSEENYANVVVSKNENNVERCRGGGSLDHDDGLKVLKNKFFFFCIKNYIHREIL